MPQVSIEFSGNLGSAFDPEPFARAVHALLVEHADAALFNCKTRLIRLDDYLIGDGSDANAMVHVDLRILPGRTDHQKRALGKAVSTALEQASARAENLDLQMTVEVRELDEANYHKKRLQG